MRALLSVLGFVALIATVPLAHADDAETPTLTADSGLSPGEYVWTPELSPEGPVVIYVDLSRQLVTVYRNAVRIGVSTTSSGRRGYETPAGVFNILQKNARHRSNRYNNAPMPYMLRLTWDGVALHGGHVAPRPVSHGCLRLPLAFARELFRITPMGGTVVVVGEAGVAAATPEAGLLMPVSSDGSLQARTDLQSWQTYFWAPERAPTGPVSIIMSREDQQLIVFRGGVEIGRARTFIPDDMAAANMGDIAVLDRINLAAPFALALRTSLGVGTTILLTESSLAPPPATLAGAAPVGDVSLER
jgi:hypothetical protein